MSIRVSCPNGHSLTGDDRLAGRKVNCPQCRVSFVVPAPKSADLSDDDVLDMLGDYEPQKGVAGPRRPVVVTPQKAGNCPKCQMPMAFGSHICPSCGMYYRRVAG